MPKVSLVLGRRTIKVYELDRPLIRIGRAEDMDIAIDNVSVSREHATLVRGDSEWKVKDEGSANGTFLNGARVIGERALRTGDEISIGKFSIFFDKVLADADGSTAAPAVASPPSANTGTGTMYIKPSDVKEMLKASAEKRQAKLVWRAGGQEGTHPLADASSVLVGSSDLCDLRVPAGPKNHLLLTRGKKGYEIRNLALWTKMKVNGAVTRRANLEDGKVIQMGGLQLTFVDEL